MPLRNAVTFSGKRSRASSSSRSSQSSSVPRIADGLRFTWQVHAIPPDILLDIPLDRVRPGCAA